MVFAVKQDELPDPVAVGSLGIVAVMATPTDDRGLVKQSGTVTRSHLLRHTMANRLLEGGASLKEVADVLRHRSLNTTMIYAKLDSRNLTEVALAWPGSAA